MDEFGSPLIGGIRAVRRNISSSFFGAPRQSQPDPVTTNLLQQQSLSLTSISQQLNSISGQIRSFDNSLQGVSENLALSDQLDRQREAAKQNRERILAEQGLREGKESALENKIQQSLTQPLQRVGVKTQGVLGRLQNFFLILAGGWLTSTGIDLIQALSEGNVDKINELKTKFIGGLAVIAGTLTAITLGIKNTLRILGLFVSNVARVAFGGLLKVSLNGVRVLLAGLVKKAAMLGGGILAGGGIGAFISGIVQDILLIKFFGGGGFGRRKAAKTTAKAGTGFFNRMMGGTNKMFADPKKTQIPSSKPNFFQRAQRTVKKQFGKVNQKLFPTVGTGAGAMKNPARMGLNPLKNTIKNLFKKLPGKNMLAKLLGTVGLKGGLGTVLKRFGGPIGTFIFALAMGEGIGNALLSTAGFAAGAAIGQMLIPIPILGGLIGGLLGEFLLKKMFNFAKKFLGKLFGKKDQELQKNVEVSSSGMEISKSEKTYTKAEIEALNAGASMDAAGNVIPINKNGDKATQISDVPEEKPEIITIPMGGATGGGQGVSAPPQKSSNALPTINFDTNNPHTLYATSVTGAGN
ncbi:MAG: hypothetical protein VXY51_10695 [Pseudomonadota bacterium]|nr:hypothetical protein [Pseudomonadota bacterium]MEC8550640.1 hypothetical protein [Pseudomonadota bacterium]